MKAPESLPVLAETQSLHPAPARGRGVFVLWEDGARRTVPLPPTGEVLIGRAPGAALQLASGSVSREHVSVRLSAEQATLRDLGSRNGTRLNGERLGEERPLAHGDVITVGDVSLVYQSGDAGAEREATAQAPRQLELGPLRALVADPAMARLYAQAERLGPSDLRVLVLGETGTGKELLAAALHHYSPRRAGPFVAVNCAAIVAGLAESELFGHEKGAFSGADRQKTGYFEAAQGGTLFLDEIGDLPLELQAKLLRVLGTGRLQRVGSVRELSVDVRVVSATLRDLPEEVRKGRFREDLYFRLSEGQLRLPPLRERRGEAEALGELFLRRECERRGRPPLRLSAAVRALLGAYSFPGNVRELEKLMRWAAALVEGEEVTPDHLRDQLQGDPAAPAAPAPRREARPLWAESEETERQAIQRALQETRGNKTAAAKLLEISIRALYYKLERLGIDT